MANKLGDDLVEAFEEMAAYLRGDVEVESYEVPSDIFAQHPANAAVLLLAIADLNASLYLGMAAEA